MIGSAFGDGNSSLIAGSVVAADLLYTFNQGHDLLLEIMLTFSPLLPPSCALMYMARLCSLWLGTFHETCIYRGLVGPAPDNVLFVWKSCLLKAICCQKFHCLSRWCMPTAPYDERYT